MLCQYWLFTSINNISVYKFTAIMEYSLLTAFVLYQAFYIQFWMRVIKLFFT